MAKKHESKPISVIIFISRTVNLPVWWPGLKNSPTVTHACSKRLLKWVPVPGE
jgi:hypothetical protein